MSDITLEVSDLPGTMGKGLYFSIGEERQAARTKQVYPMVFLDFDADSNLIGVELIGVETGGE